MAGFWSINHADNAVLQKLADMGVTTAQTQLGINCYRSKEFSKAVVWFLKAAQDGHGKAQFYLAACYDNGLGIEQNLGEAMKWYKLAAQQGETEAQTRLEYLEGYFKTDKT